MGLGVLEDHKLPHVPGTVLLDDAAAETRPDDAYQALKHGTGRNAHIVLSPQPSEDPNDPLNWPSWKKQFYVVIVCFGAILHAGVNGPLLNASYFEIAQEVNTVLPTVVLISGYNLLAAGCAGPFVCALSRKYGKRPVYLVSCLFDIVGTAIGGSHISFKYLLAARVVQGFSTSAFESLAFATIGDLYFVHQRGAQVAAINFCLNAASNLASIICGQVFAALGLLWLFNMFQIFLVIHFLLMVFFCPETTYLRDSSYDIDITQDEKLDDLAHAEQAYREKHSDTSMTRTTSSVTIPKKTFWQELAVFTGTYHNDWMVKDLLGPFLTLLNPVACYSVVASGLLNAWYVGTAIIISAVFSSPPYNYGASQVANIGAGPFIGGLLAFIVTMTAGDPVIKYLGRKNNGIYEPEFRLTFMAPAGAFCAIGMFLFGYAMSIGANPVLCAFLMGIQLFGIVLGIWSAISYGLDAFRNLSSEMFVMNMLFKNFMFYGLSNFANPWVLDAGPEQIMFVYGGTSVFLALLAIPVYMFGKRLRSWWSRHDLFVALKMQKTGPVQELG